MPLLNPQLERQRLYEQELLAERQKAANLPHAMSQFATTGEWQSNFWQEEFRRRTESRIAGNLTYP